MSYLVGCILTLLCCSVFFRSCECQKPIWSSDREFVGPSVRYRVANRDVQFHSSSAIFDVCRRAPWRRAPTTLDVPLHG